MPDRRHFEYALVLAVDMMLKQGAQSMTVASLPAPINCTFLSVQVTAADQAQLPAGILIVSPLAASSIAAWTSARSQLRTVTGGFWLPPLDEELELDPELELELELEPELEPEPPPHPTMSTSITQMPTTEIANVGL
jgi:hypothetical protein